MTADYYFISLGWCDRCGGTGTLVDGLCGSCAPELHATVERMDQPAPDATAPAPEEPDAPSTQASR